MCAGKAANSAKPPSRWMPVATLFSQRLTRPRRQASQWPHQVLGSQVTRAPSGRVTPAPRAMTMPENSWPSVTGGAEGNSPLKRWRSVPQMPAASMRITISPGAGSGTGTSAVRMSPMALRRVACILAALSLRGQRLPRRSATPLVFIVPSKSGTS